MSITAGISATKTGFELIKSVRELVKRPQVDAAEVSARLLELQDLMLDARNALSEAEDEKTRLEARIAELTRMADFGKDCELSARVRKAGWSESARRIFCRLDSEEEFVPLVMLTGTRGSAARKGLVEQLRIGDLVDVHPAPVGKRTAARPAGLPRQQFDDAVVPTVVVRFDDPVVIAVTEPQQSGLFDRGPQQMVELRIGLRHGNTPADQFAHLVPTYFC